MYCMDWVRRPQRLDSMGRLILARTVISRPSNNMTNLSIVSFTVCLLDKMIRVSKELHLENINYNIVPIGNLCIINGLQDKWHPGISDISLCG
jgi:hypothetical protein